MKKQIVGFRSNAKLAREMWGELSKTALQSLRQLTSEHSLSVAGGDLQFLSGKWYVTHSGLLGIARRNRCCGIKSALIEGHSDPAAGRWVFRATVYKTPRSRGFVGYGDADPSNTSPWSAAPKCALPRREPSTGLSERLTESGSAVSKSSVRSRLRRGPAAAPHSNGHAGTNGSSNGQPRLRDQLCLLIRQHNLDPTLVKAYAADFCGTETLKDASRDLVESFITELAASAKKDRDALICKLNSYAQPVEANP